MNLWILLLVVVVIIFTIMVWDAKNSKSYHRLRKARTAWKNSSPEFREKEKRDLQEMRKEIRSMTNHLGDLFHQRYSKLREHLIDVFDEEHYNNEESYDEKHDNNEESYDEEYM